MQSFPQRRRVYLMRHGEVSTSQWPACAARDVPLNEAGRAQAQAAASALSEACRSTG